MTARSLQLDGVNPPPAPPPVETLDGDFNSDTIPLWLLLVLIFLFGLSAYSLYDWIRSQCCGTPAAAESAPPKRSAPKKGLRKKALPKVTYGEGGDHAEKLSNCAICLSDFAAGEEICVLPQCGHGFHVGCIGPWLVSHSSCPSCRRVLPCGYRSSAAAAH